MELVDAPHTAEDILLYNYLTNYDKNTYPFHMPGHKRNAAFFPDKLFELDITELDGSDYLNSPERDGVISKTHEKLARLYGAARSHMLVNGSTVGILAAILGTVGEGEKIAVARNCHQSVYNGLILSGAEPVYIMPEMTDYSFFGGINPRMVENALNEPGNIKVVVITSPSYEGLISDVREIARITHEHNAVLIVDEAHGAHFVHDFFPRSAVGLGADIVIQSLHKTLPALTQSAVIHFCGKRVDSDRVLSFLSMLQTSSPSYIMMGLIDRCVDILNDIRAFDGLINNINSLRKIDMGNITIVGDEIIGKSAVYGIDPSRLILACGNAEYLANKLLKCYNIQLEMYGKYHALGIATIADTKDGFARLRDALIELGKTASIQPLSFVDSTKRGNIFANEMPERVLPLKSAFYDKKELIPLNDAAGRVSGGFIIPYPPGAPVAVPGERISESIINQINSFRNKDTHSNLVKIIGLNKKNEAAVIGM